MSWGRRAEVSVDGTWLATALRPLGVIAAFSLTACPAPPLDPLQFVAVTFNTGTTEGMGQEGGPDGSYTAELAAISDAWYGDGLAWLPAVDAARAFFDRADPDVVAFQEIFYSEECVDIPPEAQVDFECERWSPGDPTVANAVLGDGWQVACHPGKPDKCAAVNRRFGTFRGCEVDFCLEGLVGSRVEGCGSGARVGRGVIELVAGGTLTLVSVHSSSGVVEEDQLCRVAQVEQVFVDLGDGEPAASGARNLILGDLNTDPARFTGWDPSADRWTDFVGLGKRFHFVTDVGSAAPPSYAVSANIDHVMSDSLEGGCWVAGVTDGQPPVIDTSYFDHKPHVCTVVEQIPE